MHADSLLQRGLRLIQNSLLACGLLLVLAPVIVLAAGAISQGFTTAETTAPTGTLMSLQSGSKSVVESATVQRTKNLIGVVGNKPLIELDSGGRRVQVVVTGLAPALISDINGPVKTGDSITASPISGVGMKASTAGLIIGTAQGNLTDAHPTRHNVKDTSGQSKSVDIGLVPVQINIRYYAPKEDKLTPLVPAFLLALGSTIAGKNVSALRVVGGVFVLLLGFMTITVMLYAGIHSGMIAIGRNPLAHSELRKGLVDVIATALGILGLTIMAIYIILNT